LNNRADLTVMARFASRLFRVLGSLRARHGLEFDEILIFFALGRLNYEPGQNNLAYVKPVNVVSLSEFLDIPRETLRRKLVRLEEKELVQRTSYGFVVKDMAVWRRLGELAQGAETES
jgi:DNA-binding MarR family transcriptional regulator